MFQLLCVLKSKHLGDEVSDVKLSKFHSNVMNFSQGGIFLLSSGKDHKVRVRDIMETIRDELSYNTRKYGLTPAVGYINNSNYNPNTMNNLNNHTIINNNALIEVAAAHQILNMNTNNNNSNNCYIPPPPALPIISSQNNNHMLSQYPQYMQRNSSDNMTPHSIEIPKMLPLQNMRAVNVLSSPQVYVADGGASGSGGEDGGVSTGVMVAHVRKCEWCKCASVSGV